MQTAFFSALSYSGIKWSGLLNLSHIEILDQVITYHRGYPMHCRMHSSIRAFAYYILVASLQLLTTNNVSRYCHMSFGRQNYSWLRTTNIDILTYQSYLSLEKSKRIINFWKKMNY